MKRRLLLLSMNLSVAVLLTSCGGGGGSSISDTSNDPLLNQQWYLHNSGQTADAQLGRGGTAGADINAFANNQLTAEAYAKGHTGAGVEVAIIDSGLEIAHEDLQANVIAGGSYNFSNNGKSKNDPSPTSNTGDHGTSVAGLVAAVGQNGVGIWGTAPKAKLRGYNLLASQGGNAEFASLGYAPAVAQFSGMKADTVGVFNKSYGRNPVVVESLSETTIGQVTANVVDAMKHGTETLRAGKGAVYVKAAGNEYNDMPQQSVGWCNQAVNAQITCYNVNQEAENNTPYQMVVGAFNASDRRASYSNTGSSLWISAPGGEFGVQSPALMTTDVSGCERGYSKTNMLQGPKTAFNTGAKDSGNEGCHYYSAFNGTSAATPVASGVVALILEANPNLSWRDVKHILAITARKIDPELAENSFDLNGQSVVIEQGWVTNSVGRHFSNAYGFGAIDVQAAIAKALEWKGQNKTLPTFRTEIQTQQQLVSDNVIPSHQVQGLQKTQTVSSELTVETVTVVLDILATTSGNLPRIDPADYQIELISPSGTRSILLTPFNAYQSGNNMEDLVLSSHAFYGEPANGTWRLLIRDLHDSSSGRYQNIRIGHAGEGKLTEFQLVFHGH